MAIVIVAVALFVIGWPLGVAVMVGTPLVLWFLDRAARPLQESSFAQLRSAGDATAAGADIVAGLRVLDVLQRRHPPRPTARRRCRLRAGRSTFAS